MRATSLLSMGVVLALGACSPAQEKDRLAAIKARGHLTCGMLAGITGFATVDEAGTYRGLDADLCRAVAAAIFGAGAPVTFVAAENVRQMREDNTIDMVTRRITWSLTRAANNDIMFGPVTFYDGQGFLVPAGTSITDLKGQTVCVQGEELHPMTLESYSKRRNMDITAVPMASNTAAVEALRGGQCLAYSGDISVLGPARLLIPDGVETYEILPQLISKEPLAPLVRRGDVKFFEVVRWTVFALIAAEEYGITAANVDQALTHEDPEVRQLVGALPGNGSALGLDEGWAYHAIKAVGNYGEIYDRNLGRGSAVKLDRGLNRLWTDGGLMYAPRLR